MMMLLVLVCLPAMAGQRTASEAQNVAMNYLNSHAPRRAPGASAPKLSLAKTAQSTNGRAVDYYVFDCDANRGFIIVSGEDKAAPVLGYCDEGTFDPTNIPDGLNYMLDCYAEQMKYLRSHPEAAYVAPGTEMTVSITPLLTTNWNQDSPYNDLCPTFGQDATHAAVGCVATATAQVMNYHKWPKKGTGEFTYLCKVNKKEEQWLSADFGNTTYDWDNMLDAYIPGSYNEVQANAVATLMSHVGIASHMGYGETSSTSTFAAMEALRDYFGYNPGMVRYSRHSVEAAKWDSLIMNELICSRPVIYTGFTPKGGGHCFVLDGCNAQGYYHFNWGWGGKSNGYFLITALNPADQGIGSYEGGYNAAQEFIANVYPDQGEPEPEKFLSGSCYKFWPGTDHVNLGQKAPIYIRYLNFNSYGYGSSAEITIGMLLSDEQGNTVQFDEVNTKTMVFEFGSNYSWVGNGYMQYTTPASLANGDYNLWLTYKLLNYDMENFAFLDNIPNLPTYIKVKVKDGVMYFSSPITETGELSVYELIAPEVMGAGNKLNLTATVANAGREYYDDVFFAFIDENDSYSIQDPININVPTNGMVTFTGMVAVPTVPGVYELALLNKDLDKISGSMTVTVKENGEYLLTISRQIEVTDYWMEMDNVSATVELANTGTGDYVGSLPYMILSGDSKWVMYRGISDIVTIPAGGTATVKIQLSFEGIPELPYKICLRDPRYPDKNYIWGDQAQFELNPIYPTILLENLLAYGIADNDFLLADNLTVVDTHDQSLFTTNGRESWIEVKCGVFYDQVANTKAFRAGTVWGRYTLVDGNPSITLAKLPQAGVVQEVTAVAVDLTQPFNPVANMVIDFSGYYNVVNGQALFTAYDGLEGDMGQAMPVAFDWLESISPLAEHTCYDLHGVIKFAPATGNGAPARKADGTPMTFTVQLTKAPVPTPPTAITSVNRDGMNINVTAGAISVKGASRVAVYNMAGALVGKGNEVQLPAGIYVVIADGQARKVAVP